MAQGDWLDNITTGVLLPYGKYAGVSLDEKTKSEIRKHMAEAEDSARLDELRAVKDKSETHLNEEGKSLRRAYIENRIAVLQQHQPEGE